MSSKLDWNQLYSIYSPKLLGICRRYVQDIYIAEDIVQESFISAIQNINQLKNEVHFYGWIKKIVINNALQHIRNEQKIHFLSIEKEQISDENVMSIFNQEETNSIFSYNFTKEDLLDSIDQLPAIQKSVFNMHLIDNFSHSDISKELKININTSKSHLLRAKKSIKNFLLKKTSNTEEKKNKKGIQLLIFLGFGNMLWAQMYQNKFSNYSITPHKNTLPNEFSKVQVQNNFKTNNNIKYKILTTFLILIFLSIGYNTVSNKNPPYLKQENTSINTENTISIEKKENLVDISKNNGKTSNDKLVEMTKPSEIPNKNVIPKYDQTSPTLKSESTSENNQNISNTSAAIDYVNQKVITTSSKLNLDSIKKTPKEKVIIKKKIIKRDTIYIEKK